PDGKRIAFTSVQDGGIDAINVDGSGQTQVIPHTSISNRSIPAWSPDASRIVFLDNADLCAGSVGRSDIVRLTYTPINPGEPPSDPSWQPLPAGDKPAGPAGGSAGPPRDYPRGIPWYPSCDQPLDRVTITSTGPSSAGVGSWVTY